MSACPPDRLRHGEEPRHTGAAQPRGGPGWHARCGHAKACRAVHPQGGGAGSAGRIRGTWRAGAGTRVKGKGGSRRRSRIASPSCALTQERPAMALRRTGRGRAPNARVDRGAKGALVNPGKSGKTNHRRRLLGWRHKPKAHEKHCRQLVSSGLSDVPQPHRRSQPTGQGRGIIRTSPSWRPLPWTPTPVGSFRRP